MSGAVRNLAIVLVALIAVGAGIASRSAADSPPEGLTLKIMPLGDSITAAENDPGGYRIKLADALKENGHHFEFVGSQSNGPEGFEQPKHEGHPGWWIDNVNDEIEGWLKAHQPDVILLHLGTNDVINGHGATAGPKLERLVNHIHQVSPNTVVLVSTIIPVQGAEHSRAALNSYIPPMVHRMKAQGVPVRFVDVGASAGISFEDLADGVHPVASGYEKMANKWLAPLAEIYAARA